MGAPCRRGSLEPGALGVCNLMLWSPGIWGGDGCEWGSLLGVVGMQTLMSHSCGHVFIHRPQKDLGMDEEGVRQPPGPPARKKFFIPLDEDAVPPAGVGRGDERNAARRGALEGRAPGGHSMG